MNLPIELAAMTLLRAHGFRVVVSRTRDSTVLRLGPADLSDGSLSLQGAHDDVAARDVCANLAHASVLVGIYPAMPGFFSTPSRMPGAVIEPLYLTDPFEGSIAASKNGQQTIARGIATAVERFLAPTRPKGS